MKNYPLCFTIAIASCLLILLCAACGYFDDEGGLIPDPTLRKDLAGYLDKAPEEITADDLATLTEINLFYFSHHGWVSDLTGLEHCVNLTSLSIYSAIIRAVSDLSPLSNLTNLRELHLSGQKITDISPLAELTNLTTLDLRQNQISDISPLVRLTNLTDLRLTYNRISDISSLARLTNLTELGLNHNRISDISSLAQLTNLTILALDDNLISDLQPLVSNPGLGTGDYVGVYNNPLSETSLITHVLALVTRGVDVQVVDSHNGLIIVTDPLDITGGNVTHGAKGIDPELLHTTGIQITFDSDIKGGTGVLRPKDGAPLDWIITWGHDSVLLFPPNGDRLQHGTEYVIELIVNDWFTDYDFEISFTTKD